MDEQARSTFIGCPSHNGEIRGEIVGTILDAATEESRQGFRTGFAHQKFSKLTQNFNMILCDALNRPQFTHFCMIHGDIVPEAGWLGKLHAEMAQTGADVISAVSPIKGPKGLTSTALIEKEAIPVRLKRLTLRECLQPAKLQDLGLEVKSHSFTGPNLVINTGLMLIDLRKDWIRNITFRVTDQILKDKNGKFYATGNTEDWLFSLDARSLGASIWATMAVKLQHVGGANFSNHEPYGIEAEDWREC